MLSEPGTDYAVFLIQAIHAELQQRGVGNSDSRRDSSAGSVGKVIAARQRQTVRTFICMKA